MIVKKLSDVDAYPFLETASDEVKERYYRIRRCMGNKMDVSKADKCFLEQIRSSGRELDLRRKKEGFDRLFS